MTKKYLYGDKVFDISIGTKVFSGELVVEYEGLDAFIEVDTYNYIAYSQNVYMCGGNTLEDILNKVCKILVSRIDAKNQKKMLKDRLKSFYNEL